MIFTFTYMPRWFNMESLEFLEWHLVLSHACHMWTPIGDHMCEFLPCITFLSLCSTSNLVPINMVLSLTFLARALFLWMQVIGSVEDFYIMKPFSVHRILPFQQSDKHFHNAFFLSMSGLSIWRKCQIRHCNIFYSGIKKCRISTKQKGALQRHHYS